MELLEARRRAVFRYLSVTGVTTIVEAYLTPTADLVSLAAANFTTSLATRRLLSGWHTGYRLNILIRTNQRRVLARSFDLSPDCERSDSGTRSAL